MPTGILAGRDVTIDGLSCVRPDLQLKLLRRHEAELNCREIFEGDRVNFGVLGQLIYERPDQVPIRLMYELAMLNRFKSERHYGLIQQHASHLDSTPGDATPADLVALLLIQSPKVVERLSVEATDTKSRRYTLFLPVEPEGLPPPDLRHEAIESLRQALDDDFAYRHRGEGARVYSSREPSGFQFIIRRGDLYKRFCTIDPESTETVHVGFRPEIFDVVCFDTASQKLRVSAASVNIRTAYAQLVGQHIFGHLRFFDEKGLRAAFTLDPLLLKGEKCLSTDDVPGLSGARLTALDWSQGHSDPLSVKWRSSDLLISMQMLDHELPSNATLSRAQFRLSFAAGGSSLVEVSLPNQIKIGAQDGQEHVLDWLHNRGFAPDLEQVRAIVNRPLR